MSRLVSAYEFAREKGVSASAVYSRMKTDKNPNGDIITHKAGKQHYIDADEYVNLKFREYKHKQDGNNNQSDQE